MSSSFRSNDAQQSVQLLLCPFLFTKITPNYPVTVGCCLDYIFCVGEKANLLSLIFVIKPSTVVTIPPRVPLASSKSSSGTFTLAVSD